MSREIPLSIHRRKWSGKVALVDDEDFEHLSKWDWYARAITSRNRIRYAVREEGPREHRKVIFMHNVILGVKGVDHRNGDGLDNRRCNVRAATQSENSRNTRKMLYRKGKPTSSQYKGVCFDKQRKKWEAYIHPKNRRKRHLGRFESEVDAARAYDKAAKEHFGEFARPNFNG